MTATHALRAMLRESGPLLIPLIPLNKDEP